MKKGINKKSILIILGILIIIGIDQLIKVLTIKHLYNSSAIAINGVLKFTYVENTGGAFGIGSNSLIAFILTNIIVIGIIIMLLIKKRDELSLTSIISASMIVAGGMGNLIDRIFRGHVIDYIY